MIRQLVFDDGENDDVIAFAAREYLQLFDKHAYPNIYRRSSRSIIALPGSHASIHSLRSPTPGPSPGYLLPICYSLLHSRELITLSVLTLSSLVSSTNFRGLVNGNSVLDSQTMIQPSACATPLTQTTSCLGYLFSIAPLPYRNAASPSQLYTNTCLVLVFLLISKRTNQQRSSRGQTASRDQALQRLRFSHQL